MGAHHSLPCYTDSDNIDSCHSVQPKERLLISPHSPHRTQSSGLAHGIFNRCQHGRPFFIHQSSLLPSQCSDIINLKFSQANNTWISIQPPSCILWGHWIFKKKFRSSIGLEIRSQSVFTALRALLPSANYTAEWSGRVWQLAEWADTLTLFHL